MRSRALSVGGIQKFLIGILALILLATSADARKQLPAKPIDLNTASSEQLQELPGIGPGMARKIIELRQKSGKFRRVEDLLAVRGISDKRLAKLRPYIAVAATAEIQPGSTSVGR